MRSDILYAVAVDRFAQLAFDGDRYAKAQFPVDALPELAAYRELVVAVARELYLQDHKKRKKVPKGFESSFNLVLTAVEEGSAVPVLSRTTTANMLPLQIDSYFERARDLVEESTRRAASGGDLPAELPAKVSARFGVFGRTLREGETIYLSRPDQPHLRDAPYTPNTRKYIQLALKNEYWEDVLEVGTVTAADKTTSEFTLTSYDENKQFAFKVPRASMLADLVEWFANDSLVVLQGRALYRRGGSLKVLEVDTVDPLEEDHGAPTPEAKMPIPEQLKNIAQLGQGWLDGYGDAYDPQVVARVRGVLEQMIAEFKLPNPFIYPTPEREVRVEWPNPVWDVVATFDRDATSIWLFVTAVQGDEELDETYTVADANQMHLLGSAIGKLLAP